MQVLLTPLAGSFKTALKPRARRATPNHPPALPGFPTVIGKSQKVVGLRRRAPTAGVLGLVLRSPERHQPGFLRVQLQSVFLESPETHRIDSLRVFFLLEAQDKVHRKPHQQGSALPARSDALQVCGRHARVLLTGVTPFPVFGPQGICGSPILPEDPHVPLPCSRTPAEPRGLAFTALRCCPPTPVLRGPRRSREFWSSITRPEHWRFTLRAAITDDDAKLASGVWPIFPGWDSSLPTEFF